MIKYVLLPEGKDPSDIEEEILEDLVGYAFDDVNGALKASNYLSTTEERTAKVYRMTITIKMDEVK